MAAITEVWNRMPARARAGMLAGVVLIVALTAALGVWAYRADDQILFSDVAPADAAAMTAELDKMKTPYQLSDGGSTILVPKDLVYKTRLKLMSKELPLHGAVGFEVFNNADFGMTEFVQKVNYLRAIQGELTRTILSIEEVQAARVHLALPEQGLFKKTQTKSKASVTLTMKNGKVLAPEQVAGIQRLVAASVPDIASGDVTVLNQHGVALTRMAQGEGDESALALLDSKRGTEEYLLKKVTQVLDRSYGPGETIASVDVTLNTEQSKVTTEEVLPAKNPDPNASATGVVVRERSSASEAAGAATLGGGVKGNGAPGTSSNEFDYQVGRRVEQVVSGGGSVKRMTIAVVVKQRLDDAQISGLKDVVAQAAGFNRQRGDEVVVYSMQALANPTVAAAQAVPDAAAAAAGAELAGSHPAAGADQRQDLINGPVVPILSGLVVLVLLGAAGVGLVNRRMPPRARLSEAEREQMLDNVKQWIAASPDQQPSAREL